MSREWDPVSVRFGRVPAKAVGVGESPLDLSPVVQIFIEEAEGLLQSLEQGFLLLESATASSKPIKEMLCHAHTWMRCAQSLHGTYRGLGGWSSNDKV